MDKFRRFGRGNPDKVRLARLKGELVDRPQAIAHVFKLARSERDAWLNWPARVSAQMAAKLGVDAHSMHVTLEAALRKCGGGNNCCIALQSISRLIRGRNLRQRLGANECNGSATCDHCHGCSCHGANGINCNEQDRLRDYQGRL
jgi:hypothetical protein